MSKSFHDMLNAHKTEESSKLSPAQRAYRDYETRNAVEEILRKNSNASAEYLKELSVKLFAEAEKKESK